MTESDPNIDRSEAFFVAVKAGDLPTVERALEEDPTLVEVRQEGGTALHHAAWENHLEIARLLIARGARLDSIDSRYGMLPVAWANEHGHMDMVEALAASSADLPFQLSAAFGLIQRVRDRLDQAPSILDEPFNYGTALQYAALWGQADVVELLLESGADTGVKDSEGRSPLAAARAQTTQEGRSAMLAVESRRDQIQRGCERVVTLLRAVGAPE